MGEPILIFCLAIAGTLSYAYIRQLIYNKRQRQLENNQGNRRSILVVSGRSNTYTNTESNPQIPPKYDEIVNREESPPDYQEVLHIYFF